MIDNFINTPNAIVIVQFVLKHNNSYHTYNTTSFSITVACGFPINLF